MEFTHPQYLVEAAWLEAHLNDPDLRILDCTLLFYSDGGSGRDAWRESHIPGSIFVDLSDELSDQDSDLPFMLQPASQFAETMSNYGVGEGTRVVLYDNSMNICATRVWWMLQAYGFDHAAVLNGGWHKWIMENRPISTDPSVYPQAHFVVRPCPNLFIDKHDVLTSINDKNKSIINALKPEEHSGKIKRYARPGHIPFSVNVPAQAILGPEFHTYLSAEQLLAKFEEVGALGRDQVIIYCGGGIAATSVAFALHLLGVENVVVYDGSLLEWAADRNLPMEVG